MSDGNGDTTNGWKTRLDELIRTKDENKVRDKRQFDANEEGAKTFIAQAVVPALRELESVFRTHSRVATTKPDFTSASLTVKHGDTTELKYSLTIKVSPQGAVATSSAQLPGMPPAKHYPLTNLNDKNIALLTKEDIVDDVISCYAQSF